MTRGLLLIPALALTLAGCHPAPDAPVTPPTTAAVTGPVAFDVRLGAGETLQARPASPGGCPGLDARVDLGQAGGIRLAAYASTCEAGGNDAPGNGRHGVYRSGTDIPAARSVTVVHTALGDAEVFNQPYYECTNSCRHFTEAVAVITLEHPADPAYRTLTAYAERGDATPQRLTAFVRDQLAAA